MTRADDDAAEELQRSLAMAPGLVLTAVEAKQLREDVRAAQRALYDVNTKGMVAAHRRGVDAGRMAIDRAQRLVARQRP